jgi:hypothetical protein
MKRHFITAAAALSLAISAHAATITGLVDTGTGATGTQDTNYQLSVLEGSTVLTSSHAYVTDGTQFPIGPWIANSDVSKWITPFADQAASLDPTSSGAYDYKLTFNVAGDLSTAALSGRFAADDSAVVELNGVVIGTGATLTSWTSFSANSGFVSGVNTLEFLISNAAQSVGNPTGLRVEFNGPAAVSAVPEPASVGMLLAGLGLMGFVLRRRA